MTIHEAILTPYQSTTSFNSNSARCWRGLAVTRWFWSTYNIVAVRRARLILGWVTVYKWVNDLSVTSYLGRLSLLPSVGRWNEHQTSVGVHDGSLQADSHPKLVGMAWGLVAAWCLFFRHCRHFHMCLPLYTIRNAKEPHLYVKYAVSITTTGI